jgi:PPK2 family polyphosphate:nucleotide phosphotransferase
MMAEQPGLADVRKAVRVDPGKASKFKLSGVGTKDRELFADKTDAEASLADDVHVIDELQDAMFASKCGALLVVLQGIDTAGKDGTTKAVFALTSPLGVRVQPFGRPSDLELMHDYLWRAHAAVPQLGHIGVFNRSHYEDVLVVKVRGMKPKDVIEQRYEQINQFEKMLCENGVRILKCMLHISKDEQKIRLQERLDEPRKRWKFNAGDLEDRKLWDDFQDAYETVVRRTSTPWAPWHVVPSDSKSRRNAIIARLVRAELEDIDPKYPEMDWKPSDFVIE